MSDNEDSASHGNRFSRRKSKVQKEMETCMNHVSENESIAVDCSILPPKIGFTELFIKFVQQPDLVSEFNTFANKGSFSEQFFNVVLAPRLLKNIDNAELRDALSLHMWARIFGKGRTTEYQENAERAAIHRLQLKYGEHSALIASIRQDAFTLLDRDECMPEFASIWAQAKVLSTSADVHYGFFPIIDSLKNQLAETICMNTAVNDALDIRGDIVELFVRNQLLQFAKTNHSNKGNVPDVMKFTVKLTTPMTRADILTATQECATMLKALNADIVGSHAVFVALKRAAADDIKPSEDTITKTQLRHWVNHVLTKEGIDRKIKNSYDIVYCRILNYLGMVYDFSVRGNFRYPLEIDSVGIEPRKYTKKKAAPAAKANDPQSIVDAFDRQLETLRNTTIDVENQKRTYLSNPAVQEHFKRQRMDSEADIMDSIDEM
jgi:hypothetical protein